MRDYKTLDAITVTACLLMLAGVFAALVYLPIPQPNLPILASLASGTAGTFVGLYAGARWGNKKAAEDDHVPPAIDPPLEDAQSV